MGFLSHIVKTITKPISSVGQSLNQLAHGDISGALQTATLGGLDPITESVLGKSGLLGGAPVSSGDPATDFARQQYEDFQRTFGPAQRNLSAYYSNLTPEYYARQGIDAFNRERDNSLASVSDYVRQNNIGSDAASQIRNNMNISSAETRAQIRRSAPEIVSNQQQNFLQLGLTGNSAGNLQNVLNNNQAFNRQQQQASAQANAQTAGSLLTLGGSLAQSGINAWFS